MFKWLMTIPNNLFTLILYVSMVLLLLGIGALVDYIFNERGW